MTPPTRSRVGGGEGCRKVCKFQVSPEQLGRSGGDWDAVELTHVQERQGSHCQTIEQQRL